MIEVSKRWRLCCWDANWGVYAMLCVGICIVKCMLHTVDIYDGPLLNKNKMMRLYVYVYEENGKRKRNDDSVCMSFKAHRNTTDIKTILRRRP